jgi:hypothetical protein
LTAVADPRCRRRAAGWLGSRVTGVHWRQPELGTVRAFVMTVGGVRTLNEVWVELRGGPAGYTNVAVYRDNGHQLPATVEVIVTGGVLDYKLTSALTTPEGYPIYRCPTNWRLAVRPAEPVPLRPTQVAAQAEEPVEEIDPLDALFAEFDAKDARANKQG